MLITETSVGSLWFNGDSISFTLLLCSKLVLKTLPYPRCGGAWLRMWLVVPWDVAVAAHPCSAQTALFVSTLVPAF